MPEQPSRRYMRFQWSIHRIVWSASGGRLGRKVLGMPVLELETTGHKSGLPRRILISYVDTPHGPALAGTTPGPTTTPPGSATCAPIRKPGCAETGDGTM